MRGAQGWFSRDIATPHESPVRGNTGTPEYQLFSTDLSSGLVFPEDEGRTLLSSQASEPTPYIRREGLCDAPATASEHPDRRHRMPEAQEGQEGEQAQEEAMRWVAAEGLRQSGRRPKG